MSSDSKPARRTSLFAFVALAVLVIDVVSKILVVANIELPDMQTKHVRVFDGAIYLDVVRNSGAAFSLGTGFTAILSIIAIGVVVVIIRTASRMHSAAWAIALGLILGGALGNLTDRIFRGPGVFRGYVVDWISLFAPDGQHWPIFNAADSAIVCGAVLAALLSLFGVSFQTARPSDDEDDSGAGEDLDVSDSRFDGGPDAARSPGARD